MIENMYNQPRTAKPIEKSGTKISQGSKFNILIHEGKEIEIPAAQYIKQLARELQRISEELITVTSQNRSLTNELHTANRRINNIEGKLGR